VQSDEGRMGLVIPVLSKVCDVAQELQRRLKGAHKQKMGNIVEKLKRRLQRYCDIPWVAAATVVHPLLLQPMGEAHKATLKKDKALVDGFMATSPLRNSLRQTTSRYLREREGGNAAAAELLFYLGRQGDYAPSGEEELWSAAFTSPPETWWRLWASFHDSKLAAAAATLAQVPAGTAAAERVFSTMGWQSEKRRNRLLTDKIHKLTTVHQAFRVEEKPSWWDGLAELQDKIAEEADAAREGAAECPPTGVLPAMAGSCKECDGEVEGAHKCDRCGSAMHGFCGTGIGKEGYGQTRRCSQCS
jgi:C4-dicarboxylate-specific signal transduction histidine kinase